MWAVDLASLCLPSGSGLTGGAFATSVLLARTSTTPAATRGQELLRFVFSCQPTLHERACTVSSSLCSELTPPPCHPGCWSRLRVRIGVLPCQRTPAAPGGHTGLRTTSQNQTASRLHGLYPRSRRSPANSHHLAGFKHACDSLASPAVPKVSRQLRQAPENTVDSMASSAVQEPS